MAWYCSSYDIYPFYYSTTNFEFRYCLLGRESPKNFLKQRHCTLSCMSNCKQMPFLFTYTSTFPSEFVHLRSQKYITSNVNAHFNKTSSWTRLQIAQMQPMTRLAVELRNSWGSNQSLLLPETETTPWSEV